jgi:hypothetical protein
MDGDMLALLMLAVLADVLISYRLVKNQILSPL